MTQPSEAKAKMPMTSRPIQSMYAPRLLTWFLSAAAAMGASGEALAGPFLHAWENRRVPDGRLSAGLEGGVYSSTSNFAADGSAQALPNLRSYSRFQGDLLAGYGISSVFSVFARLSLESASLDLTTGAGSSQVGLGSAAAGVVARVIDGETGPDFPLSLDLQAQIELPAYSNSAAAASAFPFLGDGSTDLTGGAFATLPFERDPGGRWQAQAGMAFLLRQAPLSSALPWSVGVSRLRVHEGLVFGVAALGLLSLRTDSRAGPTSVLTPSIAGGSVFIGAVNPSLIAARAHVGYQFSHQISATAFGSLPVWGQAAPKGVLFGATLTASFPTGGEAGPAPGPERQSSQQYGRSNRGFVNYVAEARVTKVNDRLNMVKIDKGSQDGVAVGQVYDLFSVKADGVAGETIARARVTQVQPAEAALSVVEYYREVWIEEGFVAKRPLP